MSVANSGCSAVTDLTPVDHGPRVADDRSVRHRTVVIVVFDQVQGLDVFGPADVFYFANYLAGQAGQAAPYTVHVAAAAAGPVRTAAGPMLYADRGVDDPRLRPEVLLVTGGLAVGQAAADPTFVAALRELASRSEEVGSVCTGALLLAQAGLVSGRRITTHWALADLLAANHPQVTVDADSLYIHDGSGAPPASPPASTWPYSSCARTTAAGWPRRSPVTSSSTCSERAVSGNTARISRHSRPPTPQSLTCWRTSRTTRSPI